MKLTHLICLGVACLLAAFGSQAGAWSLVDPLTSFDAGNFTVDAVDPIVYDASGAHFGTGVPGDDGRSYQRTIANLVGADSFVAEITFETTSDDQQVFFGMGTGDIALWGTPDWSTQFSSASFWPETDNNKFVRFKTANDVNSFDDTTVAGFDPGVHRFRMTFTKATNFLLGEIDINYAGGPFVADPVGSNFPISVASLIAVDGWPGEPSRIFFGGDDGTIFRDLTINAVPEPTSALMLLLGLTGLAVRRGR
jgi:hypothetical protein